MTPPTFSLDTPTDHTRILSGYNFREVAPETLSPLSWSIIGAGMERGFREMSATAKVPFPETSPMFVAYLAFRPFHVLTSIDRMLRGLPGISRSDPWELLLGGPPPPGPDIERPALTQVTGAVRQALLLRRNGTRMGEVGELVARAELEVLHGRERAGRWGLGAAAEATRKAGRAAWALHCRTTSAMVGAAALLRRALHRHYEPEDVRRLVAAAAKRRNDEVHASAEPGLLQDHLGHLSSYEVASLAGRFAVAGDSHSAPKSDHGIRMVDIELEVPLGSALSGVYSRLGRFLRICVAERERSKNLGLRALHCLRILLAEGLVPLDDEDAALLGIDELRDLSPEHQQRLIEQRADEYARALELEVPVDVRQTPDGYEKVIRPRPRGRVGQGDGLAPGWAEGKPLVQVDPDGEVDILCGHRVDGNDVLALRPLGVVTEVGSILSHVAIVCRELGIPLVAGVDIADFDGSSSVVVDGWTGTVQVSG
jgi:phosphohistidine swiveling domain-containing protein